MNPMSITIRRRTGLIALLASLAGCAVIPDGPSTMALPGSTRTFAEFRADDDACRRFATERIGGQSAQRAAQDTVAGGAIAGAVIGAAAGAALGGSQGAGVGAGTGLLVGSAMGSGAATGSAIDTQRRYDHAYIQCMYANGHKVPVAAGWRAPPAATVVPSPSPVPRPPVSALPQGVPPPPLGTPPAPPPGVAVPGAPPAATVPPPPPAGTPPAPPPNWRSG